MPNEFKVVLAGLFELARSKTAPPASAEVNTAAFDFELNPGEPVGSGEPVVLGESGGADRNGEEKNGTGIRASGENNVDTQPVATEETADASTAGQDGGGGQGGGSAMLLGEGEEASTSSKAGTAPPDWLADPKTFVSRVLLWTEEGGARRSKFVRARPPKRVFPL